MATKTETKKLDRLLAWKREDRLPDCKKLFNQQVSETMALREYSPRLWELEVYADLDGKQIKNSFLIKHKTLVNLALTIIDAVDFIEKRPL